LSSAKETVEGKLKGVVTVRGIFHHYGRDYDDLVGFCENTVKNENRDLVLHLDLLSFDGGPLERALEHINTYCREKRVKFYITCPRGRKDDYKCLDVYRMETAIRLVEDAKKEHEPLNVASRSPSSHSY